LFSRTDGITYPDVYPQASMRSSGAQLATVAHRPIRRSTDGYHATRFSAALSQLLEANPTKAVARVGFRVDENTLQLLRRSISYV